MRVAVVYSDYRKDLPSGERTVVQNEMSALLRAGIEARLFSSSTDDRRGDKLYATRAAVRVATGFGASPLKSIRRFEPDIVHVHNLFPNFGSRWVEELRPPLVVTLHNYRSICAQGSLFRDGSSCTLCPDGARVSSLRHRCYRGSALATLPLTIANAGGLTENPLIARADRIVLLSERQRRILTSYGLPDARTVVAPSFLSAHGTSGTAGIPTRPRLGWVFIGRLEPLKGIMELISSWPGGEHLDILGDGPLYGEVQEQESSNIRVHGQQPAAETRRILENAEGLIFPGRAMETQGLVYLDSIASGTPLIALEGNAVADAVAANGTGVTVRSLAELPDAMKRLRTNWTAYAASCASVAAGRYSETTWVSERIGLYRSLCAESRSTS